MPRACNIPPHLLAFCGSAQPQSGPAVATPVARGDKAGRPCRPKRKHELLTLQKDEELMELRTSVCERLSRGVAKRLALSFRGRTIDANVRALAKGGKAVQTL